MPEARDQMPDFSNHDIWHLASGLWLPTQASRADSYFCPHMRLSFDQIKPFLLPALGAAGLIVVLRWSEQRFFSGQLSIRLYITLIGLIFLGVGTWLGLRFRREQREASDAQTLAVEAQQAPAATVNTNEILSARENEVLLCLASGLTNKQIAEKLFVSENTIKKHIAAIYLKLEVNRRTQAVLKARSLGILS